MRKVTEEVKQATRKRAWTNYNKSPKKKAAMKRYYESHKEILWEKGLKWHRKNKEKSKEYCKKWRAQYGKEYYRERRKLDKKTRPLFVFAHDAVNNALKRGDIERKSECERCGGIAQHKHHPDYSKPLEIIWLCALCHKKEHGYGINNRNIRVG